MRKVRDDHTEQRPRRRRRRGRLRRPVPAPPSARPRVLDHGARERRRRRRHLVLEPLPGRALRHREHRLLVQLRSGARDRVAVVGAVRDAARDPPLPGHVADKHDLRRDIGFSTRVESAAWDDDGVALARAHRSRRRASLPLLRDGDAAASRCPRRRTSTASIASAGETYFTSRWPHEGVDFTGKRVAVIGTGSSAIQSIPLIAQQAAELTVFQRTPNFSRPAHNGPVSAAKKAAFDADPGGLPRGGPAVPAPASRGAPAASGRSQVSAAERLAKYEDAYAVRRPARAQRHLRRHRRQPRGERDRVRVPARQDPLDRARSRDGGGALPEEPLLRHQAAVHRHQLLRDLQPAPRPPGRPAQGPDPHDHRNGHRHGVAILRVRRHRLRHGLRRDDRCDRRRRHRGARRTGARRQVGRRSEDLPRAHDQRASRTSS